MTPAQAEVFSEALRRANKPARLDCEVAETDIQKVCLSFQNREQEWLDKTLAHHNHPSGVLFGFHQGENFNAFAIEYQDLGSSIISFSPSCVFELGTFFNCAFSLTELFPEIGDARAEIPQVELRATNASLIRPVDKTRRDVAKMLTMWCIRFLTAHELGHVLNGHIRLLQQSDSNFAMTEDDAPAQFPTALTIQTLEMDADAFAVKYSLEYVLRPSLFPESRNGATLHPIYDDPRLIVQLWSFCIYSIFRQMGHPATVDFRSLSHPPPEVRLLMAHADGISWADFQKFPAISSLFPQSMHDAIVNCERAYEWITQTRLQVNPLNQQRYRTYYPSSLLAHWKELRPRLVPLSYAKGELAS